MAERDSDLATSNTSTFPGPDSVSAPRSARCVEERVEQRTEPALEVLVLRRRMREMHDLTHTVTGYDRDQLGELRLLTFMYRQQGNLGMLMIVAMAWKRLPPQARKAVREAWRNGKRACWRSRIGKRYWHTRWRRSANTLSDQFLEIAESHQRDSFVG